jgi:5-formyltetrahydrofolate cyclo-ligase
VDKAILRKLYLEKRQNLSRSEYWMLTDAMMDQVKLFNWSQYSIVHLFLPIRNKNEVDTFSILNYFKENFPDLKIVIPRTNFQNLLMENVLYDYEYTILGRNKLGIPEPIHGKIIAANQIDLVFIPLLAYDKLGNRAGYGKGFYDRFLMNCRPDTMKIGLSYFDPIEEIYDLNQFDIKMDACICPGKIWEF